MINILKARHNVLSIQDYKVVNVFDLTMKSMFLTETFCRDFDLKCLTSILMLRNFVYAYGHCTSIKCVCGFQKACTDIFSKVIFS